MKVQTEIEVFQIDQGTFQITLTKGDYTYHIEDAYATWDFSELGDGPDGRPELNDEWETDFRGVTVYVYDKFEFELTKDDRQYQEAIDLLGSLDQFDSTIYEYVCDNI